MSPIDNSIDVEKQLDSAYASGPLSVPDINDYKVRLTDDPRFDQTFDELVDTREATLIVITYPGIDGTVSLESNREFYSEWRRRAFIAPSDVNFGILMQFRSLEDASPMNTQVFRDMPSARAWLSLEETS
jgi:hypothetical protein